jgi:hypothetical protein
VGIVHHPELAAQLAAAGCQVTHFDLTAQKNIQLRADGYPYLQLLARAGNLPLENQTLDQLYFTAHDDVTEFATEILEALRVLKNGGQAIIQTNGRDTAAACQLAGIDLAGDESALTIILTRDNS